MLSIAQSLPEEIIREILKYFAAPLLIRIDGTHEFPWHLGHVCSPWRAAFISMHQEFWNKFLLYPAISRTPKSEQKCADMAGAFLERSNGNLFSFEIHRNSRSPSVLNTFLRESTRWHDVSFAIGEEEIPILESIKGHLFQLHSLTLVITPADWAVEALRQPNAITNVPQSCSGIFMDAPSLVRVRLSDLSTWQFNWSSLITLELIKPVPNPYLLQALPHMQNLEKLLVNQQHNVHYNYIGVGPISLPRLRILTIFGFALLPILVSPSLNELYLDVAPYNAGWDNAPGVCASFFQRSSCTIQRLGIKTATAEIIEQILWLTPQILFLSIHVDYELSPLPLLAKSSNGQSPLAPKLQSLRVTFSTKLPYPLAMLSPLITVRTAKIFPYELRLKELTIALDDKPDPDYIAAVNLHRISWDIQLRIVTSVGPDSDLGSVSGEYDSIYNVTWPSLTVL